ncbi:hypothetical protein VTN77DRAFT_5421 [Rasamsonia byssochlamydoides]|uniref:uncharacterized protein n=1 Tax=Rasamsonia byssochlamydoides TaxID=89139 RepID=UPI0037425693
MEESPLSSFLALLTVLAMVLGGSYLYRTQHLSRSRNRPQQLQQEQTAKHQESSATVFKESEFPDNWWTGKEVFELEKRAIFSKTWIYICHRSRFSKPGDYHSFELAGFPIFLILGKDNVVRAFHNVCRHRAYTITRKESGSSTVLGCRYHGWSYNTRGTLIKAPHFENVPGFDKSQNGLFEIHTAMSKDGLIFVNLDANPTVSEPDFKSADAFTAQQRLGMKSTWISGSTFEGKFNWKAAVESRLFDVRIPEDQIPRSAIASIFRSIRIGWSETQQPELKLFPNSTLYRIPDTGLWYSICLLPSSEAHTRVRCDLYSILPKVDSAAGIVSDRLDEIIRDRIKDVEKEFVSSAGARPSFTNYKHLNEDNRDTQYEILLHLKTHLKLEKTLGSQVSPASRRPQTSQRYLQAEMLCKELDCLSKKTGADSTLRTKEVLAW